MKRNLKKMKLLVIFVLILCSAVLISCLAPPRRPRPPSSASRSPGSQTTPRPTKPSSQPATTQKPRRHPTYSDQEKQFLIQAYYESCRSVGLALKKWSTEFKNTPKPSYHMVNNLIKKFEASGNVANLNAGRDYPCSSRTPENIERIDAVVEGAGEENPLSVRRIGNQVGLSRSTVHRILKEDLGLNAYKIQLRQKIPPDSVVKRVEFAKTMKKMIADGDIDVNRIIFTDEAHFELQGYVNKQNFRIWGSQKPETIREAPLHPERISVWCGVTAEGILGPYQFEDTINGENYRKTMTEVLKELDDREWIDGWWWQQDGAPAHTAKDSIALLEERFEHRMLAKNSGGIEWPPYSPDLNPPDYFLWGFLKDKVYASNPTSIPQLKENIEKAIELITPDMLERVMQNFEKRLDAIIESSGRHIEGFLV